jgi:Raf kinase inhibitor-like YbhB/YbcL family protein
MIGTRVTARRMLRCVVALVAMSACTPGPSAEASLVSVPIDLSSAAFEEGGSIPSRFTCDGDDIAPPLAWTGTPDGTAAFALIVDDPDARGWVHWVVADIAPDKVSSSEGASPGTDGRNDFGRIGWGGPCPPSGTHRYVFEIFALSAPLELSAGFSADDLRAAVDGKLLGSGRLSATYPRGGDG